MRLSLIILTKKRLPELRACLSSLSNQIPSDTELLAVVNGRDPETLRYLETQSWVRVLPIDAQPRSHARNFASSMARGEIVYFLDDDVVVPPGVIEKVIGRFAADPSLAVLGGPNLTPPASPFQEELYGAVMTSPFAAPMVHSRYGSQEYDLSVATEHDLILCNLAIRKRLLPKSLAFRAMTSNEENLFLYECKESGVRVAFSPEVGVYHKRRSSFLSFMQQIVSYGRGRAEQTAVAPRSMHPLFAVPVLSCVILALSVLGWVSASVVGGLFLLHQALALMSAVATPALRRLGAKGVVAAVPLTGFLHLSYGLGFAYSFPSAVVRRTSANLKEIGPLLHSPIE